MDYKEKSSIPFPKEGVHLFPIRLKEIIGEQTLKEFAAAVGVSEGGLRKYLPPAKSVPAFDKLVAMACYAGVNIDWLATGRGEKFPGNLAHSPNHAVLEVDGDEFELIDGYHIAIGELGCDVNELKVRRRLAFRKKWLEYRGLEAESLKIFFVKSYVEGGVISGGDSVMINTADTVPSDGVFAVNIRNSIVIRWFSYRIDGSVDVYKDITETPYETINEDQLKSTDVLGRVVWLGKDFK